MHIEIGGFDWDQANLRKLEKHKVTQEEAEGIFYLTPLIDEEAYERGGEKRYRCLGMTAAGRRLAVFFTIRRGLIRNISVRPMRRQERRTYEAKKNI